MAPRRQTRRPERRDFWRAREGATAVEFALIAFPFFFMLFAIIEVALYFTVDSVLDNATIETGRLIRTGQAEAQGMTPQQFKDRVCERMTIFATDCDSRMAVTVEKIDMSDPPKDPLEEGQLPTEAYTNGSAGDLMLVRVWYTQPMMTGFLAKALANWPDGQLRLSAASAFRNEPK